MKFNKALGFMAALACSMALMGASAYAAEFSAGAVTADAGATVTVPVVVTPDTEGTAETVNGYIMTLTYDPTLATPVATSDTDSVYATVGDSFASGILVSDKVTSTEADKETIVVAWAAADPVSVSTATSMATVSFKVADNATGSIPVTVAVSEMTADGTSLSSSYTVKAGSIDLSSAVIYGDVNGDGLVTSLDADLVLQHAAQLIVLSEDYQKAAEVSGDGLITSLDADYILQYAAQLITAFPVESN